MGWGFAVQPSSSQSQPFSAPKSADPFVAPPPAWWWLRVRLQYYLHRFYRLFPRLVWLGDQVDVLVTFSEARLPATARFDPANPSALLSHLNEGHLAQVEAALREIGVEFDKGVGVDGRDWEWDWSLRGPISVKFVRRTKDPAKRNI